jgi:hypothetical protein
VSSNNAIKLWNDTPRVPRRLNYVDATVARAAACC